MDNNLVYMPTFRVRQQESIVLRSFDFGRNMYPLLEIVKEHDRVRKSEQKSFEEIHIELIQSIKAPHVFIDLPIYIKQSGSVKDEVVEFSFRVINNLEIRCEYINKLMSTNPKSLPVIASYLSKTGEANSIEKQFDLLSPNFNKIAFRLFPSTFAEDIEVVMSIVRPYDYIIIDLDQLPPYKSPPLRPIIAALKAFKLCCKIILRSAINTEIQNVKLDHGQVVIEADNNHIDTDVMTQFGVNATGDYVGIKKDDLTAGGTISPGFIYYDAVENQYYGFKATLKGELSEFENTIVPDVLNSASTVRMLDAPHPFVGPENPGYVALQNIRNKIESGKSQAKFKKIAMEHYLFCIKTKIESNELYQIP